MVDAIASWPTFIVAVLVFGFVPGSLLRLIVLAFERDDPRREELLAELRIVPRLERPFWVLEQLEVALFEGLGERLRWAATGRIIHRWRLSSGVERNREFPDSFWIPGDLEKSELIRPGMDVKLMFEMRSKRDSWGERMWVEVVDEKLGGKFVGTLRNQPVGIPRLYAGHSIKFGRDEVIDIMTFCKVPTEGTVERRSPPGPAPLLPPPGPGDDPPDSGS